MNVKWMNENRTKHLVVAVAWVVFLALLAISICTAGGCGNVYLWGQAATAAETSAMDAFLAQQKGAADNAAPAWARAYLEENFRQWRSFVRAARKEEAWGPKLPSEQQAQGPAQEVINP